MSKRLETELYKAATLTFEEMGFLLPTPEIGEQQLNAQVEAMVSVEFKGPFSGKLLVRVCGGLLPILAANMLGEEEAPPKSLQYDALGEIANVICGNILPCIAGSKELFNVSTPKMVESIDLPPAAEIQVGLGLGRADLLLFISNHPFHTG
jgi:CheY-specific phosphatase CheX